MRICFVVDLPTQAMGGVEVQCYLIGKGLAARGWDVVYITSQDLCPRQARFLASHGPAWYVFRCLRAISLLKLLKKINPDVILVSHAATVSEVATGYAMLYQKTIVYRVAHIWDAELAFGRGPEMNEVGFVARQLHRLTVRNADAIVTNAGYVANVFKGSARSLNVVVIRNGQEMEPVQKAEPSHFLWIARMDKCKNPGLFVRLARELPHIRFVMCGSGCLYDEVLKDSRDVPNLDLAGFVSEHAKKALLKTAFAFINTSLAEGFPNTLIEAGIYGIPYISFVDPDEVICRHKLGFHVRSFSELSEKAALLFQEENLRKEMGAKIRSYVEKEHDIRKTVLAYDKLLRRLV